jgi:protocadherin-15
MCVCLHYTLQGTFGREPQAKPEDDRYLRAAIQEYDNVAKLGQIMREGPIKVRNTHTRVLSGGRVHIQWGKKVFSQPPIVQILPLKKMRGL